MKRAIVLVLDGVGIGALPDAELYGDSGSNTLVNLARACGGLHVPVLEKIGLGNIASITGVARTASPRGSYGKMAELSAGKDSTSGHWELCGIVVSRPFPTYPHGFPDGIIKEFETRIGHTILGNKTASGTEIIQELGTEHMRTKQPIVYTSADSVFQIACHIDVFSLSELYMFCETARALLQGEHGVARVIARPFAGTAPHFYRTEDRRDYSQPPPGPTLLDIAKDHGFEVVVIGKVDDLFGHRGYTKSHHSVNDQVCIDFVLESLDTDQDTLIVANFVQFDMDWGHRNDVEGFQKGLVEIDEGIGKIMERIEEHDMLVIAADHGNDPTTPSTDHSREYVPLLVVTSRDPGVDLGTRNSFADVAQTIARYFNLKGIQHGTDFLNLIYA
jgi:phosphopentomutase